MDREMLLAPYTLEEVRVATFALQPNKAPGPDGMNAEFFKRCWEFMGHDIWLLVEEFRKKRKFVKELNHTVICLIPKKDVCTSMKDYRPISLCNTVYKIIAKTMAERLKKILPKIVSENQNGFTPGRGITDSIIYVAEVIHTVHKEKLKGMVIKLDVEKALIR